MTELNGAGQRVTFAVSVVAALFLSTAVWADGQDESADPGMTDGGLIAVDLIPVHPVCDGDCIAVGEPDPSGDGSDGSGVVDDGSGDTGVVDDGSGDGSGDTGVVDDGSGDGTVVDDGSGTAGATDGGAGDGREGDPVVIINYDGASDDPGCGSCVSETTNGAGPLASGPAVKGHVKKDPMVAPHHKGTPAGPVGRGPDLCLAHDPALAWICDWQGDAAK